MADRMRRRSKVDQNFIRENIENQFGVDIETTGVTPRQDRVLQLGISTPQGKLYDINIQQEDTSLPDFHRNSLGGYYKRNKIDLSREQSLRYVNDPMMDQRVLSATVSQDKAKKIASNLLRGSNKPANYIIHNANFERRFFDVMFEGASPLAFSQGYWETLKNNRDERYRDIQKMKSGAISSADVRSKDIQRQLRLYDQIMIDAQRGGNIVDTFEVSKTVNALLQQRKLADVTGDLALGGNVEMLSEVFLGSKEAHIGASDVAQQNKLAPKLVRFAEKLQRPDFDPKYLSTAEKEYISRLSNGRSLDLKIKAQQRAITRMLQQAKSNQPIELFSGGFKTNNLQEAFDLLTKRGEFTPRASISQGYRVTDFGLPQEELTRKAFETLDTGTRTEISRITGVEDIVDKRYLAAQDALGLSPSVIKKSGMVAAAGLGAVALGSYLFSGKDDEYNEIEGLRHGYQGGQRNLYSDFGSGYKGPSLEVEKNNPVYKNPDEYVDPTPFNTTAAAVMGGGYLGYKALFNVPTSTVGAPISVDDLSYMGPVPEGYTSRSEFLGRKRATFGDLAYSAVRRAEYSIGGFPKAFSVSTIMSPNILKDVSYSIDLTKSSNTLYKDYLKTLTGYDLDQEGVIEVAFNKGQLTEKKGRQPGRVLLKNARLVQAVHDRNITGAKAQYAKSLESMLGSRGIGREHDLLISGGQNRAQSALRGAHAYAHESLSKYLRLVDDPAKALRDVFPDISPSVTSTVDKLTRFAPRMGVGGERNLVGSVPQLLRRHAKTSLPILMGVPFLYGMADWGVRQMFDEDSVPGRAGLTGVVAQTAKSAHMGYAYASDVSGLTGLRKAAEEQAPGMTGLLPFAGLTLSGALTGAITGAAVGTIKEVAASDSYDQFLKNKSQLERMPKSLSKLPGFKGSFTLTGKYARLGALGAGVAALPMLLAGVGSSKSYEELDEEYHEGKEVAVKKGRWWEFGKTPFEGDKTMYYRPNWYNRTMSQYKRKSLYGDEDISPAGEAYRSIKDPYWKEKMHYDDRPYPMAGPSGEHLGIFSVLYERTIGQALKPTALMHAKKEAGRPGSGSKPVDWTGGEGLKSESGEQAFSQYSAKEDLKQQFYNTYEAIGLRGFATSALKEVLTGEREFFEQTPVIQSSSDMDSPRRDFWDLNLGGGLGLTEPYRRFMPNRPYTTEYVNSLPNQMPDWLPGENSYVNLQTGDPFTKIPEGEYRLPGAGYATRFPELEGVDPEDYPDIHKFKILADVAPYDYGLYNYKRKLESADLSDKEQNIYNQTLQQLEDRKKSREFIEDSEYKGAFGKYADFLGDAARRNPIEELTPISPAHKFLPRGSALEQYEAQIFGKDFKLWENPVSDFIKPFLYTTGNVLGADVIPPEVKEAREIEEYFDKLKYVKFKRLEKQARESNSSELLSYAKKMQGSTLIGSDLYGEDFEERALPKREREFFSALRKAEPEDRGRILEVAPDNLKDLYVAQWDKQIIESMEAGKMEVSEDEAEQVISRIRQRKATIQSRRELERQQLMELEELPGEDWEGWRSDVDLKDVKMRYLIDQGKDFHYFNLWDDRLRKMRNKPELKEIAEQISLPGGDIEDTELSDDELRELAYKSGLRNVIIERIAGAGGTELEVEHDSSLEEDALLREMEYII